MGGKYTAYENVAIPGELLGQWGGRLSGRKKTKSSEPEQESSQREALDITT